MMWPKGEIASETNRESSDRRSLNLLRAAALVAAVVGAAGSVGLMFRASQHPPCLLLVLFTLWVASPFVALLWANVVLKRWSAVTRVALCCTTLIITLASLAIYGDLVHVKPAGSANAFLFVIVPPASGAFAAIVVSMAAFISRGLSRRDAGA